MKKLTYSCIILFCFSLLLSGCHSNSLSSKHETLPQSFLQENPLSPPTSDKITGTSTCNMHADRIHTPFNEAVKDSDAIVKVNIDQLVAEIDKPSYKTVFKASILNSWKLEQSISEIHILQQGNSKCSYNENPLFQAGEQYYLILKEASLADYEHTYFILGEEMSMYKLIEDDNLVKLSYRDDNLLDINQAQVSGKLQANYKSPIMVINEQLFIEKIDKHLKK